MYKLLDRKSPIVNVIAFFSVSLAVMLLIPVIMGESRPALLQTVLHAVVIAAALGAVFALAGRRRGGESESDAGQRAADEAHGTDTDDVTHGLNQRGLTVKLLELMALGERYGSHTTHPNHHTR